MSDQKLYKIYHNEGGPDIGSSTGRVIQKDGKIFKNLSGEEALLPYEDWRLSSEERARDLAKRLSVEEIAGLMLYSPHQTIPAVPFGPFKGTYGGRDYDPRRDKPWDISDQQRDFLVKDHVRHVLATQYQDNETAAKWNNNIQAFAENQPFGVPVSFSSDPRHGVSRSGAEFKSGGADISLWPGGLGMAAGFSPEECEEYGRVIAEEYRALGITTALSPQIDIATEPRWMRFADTFGTHPGLAADFARAYCDGLQTTENSKTGWGDKSVAAMVKHWPGGGPCEGGRDAHYPFGSYAVYPGGCFEAHQIPFLEGAFKLNGPTKTASSVMPYYTVSWNADVKYGENKGNSYSKYIIHDLLREKYGFKGIVCTDWGITGDPLPEMDSFSSRSYGVESLTVAQRHLLAIENGVDQFGGNSDAKPIIEAYNMGCEKYGEEAMRARMERSAVRLLTNLFNFGLFENPYLDPEKTVETVGKKEFRQAGFAAQLRSVVMLKNKSGVLPLAKGQKVYIPNRRIGPMKGFMRNMEPEKELDPIVEATLSPYYQRVADPAEADFSMVFIESPLTDGGYNMEDRKNGGNGYLPISLQYRPYLAGSARAVSIAGGDPRESFTNRSYKGKTGHTANESDLDAVIEAKKAMGDKPVVVCMALHNPAVMGELEPYADAILIDFDVERRALLEIVSGSAEPSGLLPVQLPKDMETVEKHCEDRPFDLEPYTDSQGNRYDFGFGLNWSGVIRDERTKKYTKERF